MVGFQRDVTRSRGGLVRSLMVKECKRCPVQFFFVSFSRCFVNPSANAFFFFFGGVRRSVMEADLSFSQKSREEPGNDGVW